MCLYVSSMFSLVMGLTKLFPKLYIPFFLDEFSVLLCIICINEHMYELTFFHDLQIFSTTVTFFSLC